MRKIKLIIQLVACNFETGHVLQRKHVITHKRERHQQEDRQQVSLSMPYAPSGDRNQSRGNLNLLVIRTGSFAYTFISYICLSLSLSLVVMIWILLLYHFSISYHSPLFSSHLQSYIGWPPLICQIIHIFDSVVCFLFYINNIYILYI